MIESIAPSGLPYELIGQLVVILFISIGGVLLALLTLIGITFAWVRGFTYISNAMWNECNDGETPPVTKMKISAVAIALARFKPHKYSACLKKPRNVPVKQTQRTRLHNTQRNNTSYNVTRNNE